jgi:glutathione synthase/RimK-type ligase-like ATP-grasp enzyme
MERRSAFVKKGYIIYHPEEGEKNKEFIRFFQDHGKKQGIDFFYVSSQEYNMSDKWDMPDFVLNRTRDADVSRFYQKKKIPVFHHSSFVELANDKFAMMQYFNAHLPQKIKNKHWCPKSRLVTADEIFCEEKKEETLWQTGVIKSLHGHGGSEVFLAADKNTWQEKLAGQDVLLQERIDSDAKDVRVYVLGGEIYQGVLRSGRSDFRSNYSLGGDVKPYSFSSGEREWITCFIEALPPEWQGMYGIDFIIDRQGRFVFNEVEEMVGCRMLYQCTSCDIVGDYVRWLGRFV